MSILSKLLIFVLFFLLTQFTFGQNQFRPEKLENSKIEIDGKLSAKEWGNAIQVELKLFLTYLKKSCLNL